MTSNTTPNAAAAASDSDEGGSSSSNQGVGVPAAGEVRNAAGADAGVASDDNTTPGGATSASASAAAAAMDATAATLPQSSGRNGNANTSASSTHSESSNTSSSGSSSEPPENSSCNNIEAEYNEILERSGWHRIYQEIRDRCDREAYEKNFSTSESEKAQNRCRNRYRDVSPYNHSRIILHRGRVDYINANLVKCERADRKYILTQGPLADTVGHFWLMVWEQKSRAILMLNKLMEKKQVKCFMYWPSKRGHEHALQLDEVQLTVEFVRCEEYKNFSRRWFKLTDLETKQSREIIQFHYTTWPDFGIPSSPVAFLQFLKQVRDSGALDTDVGPAVVHCSAGIGRSGTFCLVDCCLVLVDKEGVNNVSVQNVLCELRRYRMGLIQTADQLYFSYQAIIEGIRLLKDKAFLEYNEEPYICNDDNDGQDMSLSMDETPPPLPPRTFSLPMAGGSNAGGNLTLHLPLGGGKPLPMIPVSESFNDDLYNPNDNQRTASKDALNNFMNNEKQQQQQHNDSMSNRPLPPLPPSHKNNMLRVLETDDSKDLMSGSDEDDDDADQKATNGDKGVLDFSFDNDDGEAEESDSACEPDNDDMPRDTKSDDAKNANATGCSDTDTNATKTLNGLETTTKSPKSPDQELKQRRRHDRQKKIEQTVADIKRKQREAEESKCSAKRRRSLTAYIAAGVVVGVVCVYAYAKLSG